MSLNLQSQVEVLQAQLRLAHAEIARLEGMLVAAGIEPAAGIDEWSSNLFMRVEDLPFSTRVKHVLETQGIVLVWQLAEQEPKRMLSTWRQFKNVSLQNVEEVLATLGVSLGTVFPPNFPRTRRR